MTQVQKKPVGRPQKSKWSNEQKQEELWRRGILAPWKLYETQQKMVAAIRASAKKKFVINASRRLGKSYALCVLALEQALQNPHQQIKFAAPSQKMARKIIMPLMRQILENAPQHLKPKFTSFDGVFEFANGSEIHIAGTELAQIDNLRGQSCDLGLIDEAGFCSDLEYVIESVLMPQTLTRPGSKIILASTPPVTPDHPFVSRYMANAIADNAYAKYTIYDNNLLTPEQIAEYMEEAGGEDSTTWQREYLANPVTDRNFALFPEATEEKIQKIVLDISRPSHWKPLTVLDLGYVDFTGILCGYWHFPAGKLVIEDEVLINKSTSSEIIAAALQKERYLWGDQQPGSRIVDGNALAIADMNELHQFRCHAPDKSDLTANVNRVRMDIANETIVIHPRCKQLISQLQFATWDKSRSKFSRSASGGHWDLIAALIYFSKHLDRISNPIPASHGWNQYTDWGFPRQHKNTTNEHIQNMFPVLRRLKTGRIS